MNGELITALVIRWFFQARESFSEHGKSTCVTTKAKQRPDEKML
jgi:hypothetical protein